MSGKGYEILSLDDLERLKSSDGELTMLPLRRTLDFRAYGVNGWLGEQAGDTVIEPHRETSGQEELYVVVRGRAHFTVGEEELEAGPGTLIHVPGDTFRVAKAAAADTIVLALGAKAGEAWEPGAWDDFFVAFAKQRAGDSTGARALVEDILARDDDWRGAYNAACFEALDGNPDAAFAHLERAVSGDAQAREWARGDADFELLHADPRWQELVG